MILIGDALENLRTLPAGSARCCVTSPPYWGLRDYGHEGQLGLERTPEEYVSRLVEVFREVRRVLADDGTLWCNLGDSYAKAGESGLSLHTETSTTGKPNPYAPVRKEIPNGLKPKDLVGIPWRVAFALQADGWYLRSDIVWSKPNPMPESVTDRPTKAHEYLFLLSKSQRYFFDAKAIAEPNSNPSLTECRTSWRDRPNNGEWESGTGGRMGSVKEGRNRRTVWTVATQPFPGAHFAVMPQALVEPCILAGSEPRDTVLDPFAGAGTVGVVAARHGREFVGIELNADYARMARNRIQGPLFAEAP